MQKIEFTQRTGIELTDEQYQKVEDLYLNAGNMDKDEFCEDYKKHKDSKLLAYFYKLTEDSKFCAKLIDRSMLKVTKFLLMKSREVNDKSMRSEAIDLLGENMIVRLTIEMDLELWSEDKKFLIESLTNNNQEDIIYPLKKK